MSDKDKFKELVFAMPERERQVLWGAANAMNDNDSRPLSLCRAYLPALTNQEAWAFMLWLRKQTIEDLQQTTKAS